MAAQNIITAQDGHVLIVMINRPERRNAIDHETARALEAVWDAFEADVDLRAAILTGGETFFCAGADLKAAARGAPPARTARRGPLGTVAAPPQKPLLVAVEGDALGGGFELALSADIIVASRTARFGLPECQRGVLAAAGGVIRLPQRIPASIAREMVFSGLPFGAERLHALGLVNHLTEPGSAFERALELAKIISDNAPLAVAAAKRVMSAAAAAAEAAAWALQAPELERLRASADYREGIAAFAEKRAPHWRNA